MIGSLTRVTLVSIPRQLRVYLRFGQPHRWSGLDLHRRYAFFEPGRVFCRVWWQAGVYGTARWQVTILETKTAGDRVNRVEGVCPGAVIWVDVEGAWRVRRVLRMIRSIELQG